MHARLALQKTIHGCDQRFRLILMDPVPGAFNQYNTGIRKIARPPVCCRIGSPAFGPVNQQGRAGYVAPQTLQLFHVEIDGWAYADTAVEFPSQCSVAISMRAMTGEIFGLCP